MLKPITFVLLVAAGIAAAAAAGFALLRNEDPPPAPDLSAQAGPPIGGTVENFTPIDPPRPAPDVTFADADGQPVRLMEFRGSVVLLNLWATWCAPCIEEMPSLDRLQAKIGTSDFAVVAVSQDTQGPEIVRPFFERLKLAHLPLYTDRPNAFADALNIQGLPASLLIDRSGRAVGAMLGAAQWDAPEAEALIRYYLGKGGSAPGAETIETGG
jgi:thiol-disulfide isomerase/thioredoxin